MVTDTQFQENTEVVTPTQPTQKPRPTKTFLLLFLVLCALMVGSTLYFKGAQKGSGTPSPLPIAQPIPDPTAGWETYTNITYGYTFNYPQYPSQEFGSQIFTDELVEITGQDSLVIRVEPIVTSDTDPFIWWNKQTVESYTNKPASCFEAQSKSVIYSLYDSSKTVVEFDTNVLMLTPVQEETCQTPPTAFVILVPHEGKILKITYDWAMLSEQILSTFRFINGSTQDNSSNDWQLITSTNFSVTFKVPPDWQYYPNASNEQLKLPYVRAFSLQNETAGDGSGCAVHTGFGGGHGPTEELSNEAVLVDNKMFNKRTWYQDAKPIFISYTAQVQIPNFELLWFWVSTTNQTECLIDIDQIVSTIHFTY